jgi:hypothetical protein
MSKRGKRQRSKRARSRGPGTIEHRRLQRRVLLSRINSYGSIDTRNGLPDDLAHLADVAVCEVMDDLTIPHAEALIGFDNSRGKYRPLLNGIVIAKLDQQAVQAVVAKLTSATANQRRLARLGSLDVSRGVPAGLCHVRGKRLQPLARKLGIAFAEAIIYWDIGYQGKEKPVTDGVVVSISDAPKLHQEILARNTRSAKRAKSVSRRDERIESAFAAKIRERFPSMPAGEEFTIAAHATERGSGRVGRSTTASDPVGLAVAAHVRWTHTDYPQALSEYEDLYREDGDHRVLARELGNTPAIEAKRDTRATVHKIMHEWAKPLVHQDLETTQQ